MFHIFGERYVNRILRKMIVSGFRVTVQLLPSTG